MLNAFRIQIMNLLDELRLDLVISFARDFSPLTSTLQPNTSRFDVVFEKL